jgi:hypothetical protein
MPTTARLASVAIIKFIMTHVKNAEAFSKLVDFCTGYGGIFNPGRPTLHLDALNAQKGRTMESLSKVIETKTEYDNSVNHRKQLFDQLPRLVASTMRTLEACGAAEEKLDDARASARQILGFTTRKKSTALPVASNQQAEQPRAKGHSVLQLAYASKAESFARLVNSVSTESLYLTNETNLSVAGLTTKLNELNMANRNVSTTRVAWSNSRIERNEVMYHQTESMYNTGRALKKYVRAIFGPASEEYSQIKNISITKLTK